MTTAPRRLDRRPARSTPVVILAVVLLLLGILGIWTLGSLIIDGSWPQSSTAAIDRIGALRMDSAPVVATACVLAVLGVLMILAAILPGRRSRLRALDGDVPGQTVVGRRDVARRIRSRTEQVDGVQSTQVDVTHRTVSVRVRTVVDDTAPVEQGVREAAERAVAELRPATTPSIRVRMHRID
jgi:copper chaperone CopZ